MFNLQREMHSGDKVAIGVIALSFIAGLLFYSSLPDQVASHWNLDGLPDGFMQTELFVVGFPLLMFVVYIAISRLPGEKELKYEIELLHREYAGFKASIITFLAYIYIIVLYSNSDFSPLHVSMPQLLLPGLAVLFYYLGTVMPRLKRNHFVGIRTPWTVHNDAAWHKTHLLGAKLFKGLSVIVMFAALTSAPLAAWLVAVPLLAVAVILIAYSYKVRDAKAAELKKENNKGKGRKRKGK